MKDRIRKMPRPDVRMRFSEAKGFGRWSKSNPSPSSAIRTVNRPEFLPTDNLTFLFALYRLPCTTALTMDSRTAIPIFIRSSSSNPARWAAPTANSSALSTLSKVESRNRSTVSETWRELSSIRNTAKANRQNKLPRSGKSRTDQPQPRYYFITRRRARISRAGKTQAQCRSYHLRDRPEMALPRLSSSRLPPKVREAFSSAKPHWGPTNVSKRRSVKYSKVAAARRSEEHTSELQSL